MAGLNPDDRARVIAAMDPTGIASTDQEIGGATGMMLGQTLAHLKALEREGLAAGNGNWWRLTQAGQDAAQRRKDDED